MYLPKSKYKGDLHTSGNEFVIASTGNSYQGPYFQTFNGRYFTGQTPSKDSQEIIPRTDTQVYGDNQISNRTFLLEEYDIIRNNQEELQLKSTEPIPVFYPQPTSQDYIEGNIIRYFLRHRSTGIISEVNQEVYKAIIDKRPTYYYPGYITGKITWRIQGPRSTTVRQGYRIPGAVSINKAAVKSLERVLPGISSYLSDPGQFVR